MTAQEAIKLIKTFESGKPSFDADFTEISKDCAIHEAIEALEKQIPKKPIKAFDDKVKAHWCSCPICCKGLAWEHGSKQIKFCFECGQKLDWN